MISTTKSKPPLREVALGKTEKELKNFDLIEVQKTSWKRLLDNNLKRLLEEYFPIDDYTGKKFTLVFEGIFFGQERYPLKLCLQKKLTFDQPVYLKLRLLNKKTGTEKQQDVYFFNIPIMTDRGTFIINGIERAIISQITRAPGIYFTANIDKSTGLTLYNAEIRPYVGAWLDLTINKYGLLEIKVNKKRKMLASVFLKLFENESTASLLNRFANLDKELFEKNILPTFKKDRTKSRDEAVLEFYKKMKPGEPLILENAYKTLTTLFFDHKRYSLADVGRYKINKKLNLKIPNEKPNYLLQEDDIIATIKYLVNLTKGQGIFDEMDHLGNRRLRTVGELISMYGLRAGMIRAEKEVKERMSLVASDINPTPSQVVNNKPVIAAINTFYRTSQLSTIVDQTNPLSELDNLRRITVGGPGGIEKQRASFSIRDIASSQYGRIDPIRSPEGPNIGVVTYMALYARANEYGFLESPYKKVVKETKGKKTKMKVTSKVDYLQADDEEQYYITSANVHLDANGYLTETHVVARHKGEIIEVPSEKIDYIDISPRQAIGISASLIPFLQNDDASRALMGSHMQCQAEI